jgi:hypothetical protein
MLIFLLPLPSQDFAMTLITSASRRHNKGHDKRQDVFEEKIFVYSIEKLLHHYYYYYYFVLLLLFTYLIIKIYTSKN